MNQKVNNDQYCSLAIMGFSESSTHEIQGLIDRSYLDLRVEYTEMQREGQRHFCLSFKNEFDILILNPEGYREPIQDIVEMIKQVYPLTELVCVTETRDYDFALNAFRSGVRDVLHFPLEQEGFLHALERSQSFRSLFQSSKSLGDILSLIHQFGELGRYQSLFDVMSRFDAFICDKFSASPFLIMSTSAKRKEKSKAKLRTIWNKDLMGKAYKRSNVDDIFDIVHKQEDPFSKNSYEEVFHKEEFYYLVLLGKNEQSCYYALFKIGKGQDQLQLSQVIGHLARILCNCHEQLLLAKAKEDLSQLVHNDDVTGLFNQRKLHKDLDHYISHHKSTQEIFSVIFIDIDHFKSVNDGHGHLVGSKLLVEMAKILKLSLRDNDLTYRYGGDEFVILLPGIGLEDAHVVGHRILDSVKQNEFSDDRGRIFQLSVSIGVAEFPKDARNKKEILQIADDMMYKAKNAGRGRVVSTSDMFLGKKKTAA